MPSIIDGARPEGDKILITDGVRFAPAERVLIIDGVRVSGGAPCTEEQSRADSDNAGTFGSSANNSWNGGKFTTGASPYSLSRISLDIYKVGSPTFNIVAKIYTDSPGEPGTQVGGDSVPVDAATVEGTVGTPAHTNFEFSSPIPLDAATAYWIVIHASSFDAGNHIVWRILGAALSQSWCISPDGLAWNLYDYLTTYILYSGDCA